MIGGPQFFAEALAEYEAAATYYEARQAGLGARFVEEVNEALSTILEYPETFAMVQDAPPQFGLRSVIVRSFPVKLVYADCDAPRAQNLREQNEDQIADCRVKRDGDTIL